MFESRLDTASQLKSLKLVPTAAMSGARHAKFKFARTILTFLNYQKELSVTDRRPDPNLNYRRASLLKMKVEVSLILR